MSTKFDSPSLLAIIVNMHNLTRTSEYARMQILFDKTVKSDWFALSIEYACDEPVEPERAYAVMLNNVNISRMVLTSDISTSTS